MGRKRGWVVFLVSLGLILGGVAIAQAKSVNEKILDILLESKMVSQEKYQELKKQVDTEEAEIGRLKDTEKKYEELKKQVEAGKAEVAQIKTDQKKAAESSAKVDFKKGFSIQSVDGANKILISGRFHGDYKQYLGDNPNNDSFFIRRARLALIGTLYNYYDFMIEPDFGQGNPRLNDGFFNIHYVPYAQVQFGQFKAPFELEELHSDNWIDFIERSLANNFAPSRDLGIMVHGNIAKDVLYYQLGIFNGRKINSAQDVDDQKDLAGRVTLAPFSSLGNPLLKDFHIGGAFTTGVEHTSKPSTDWWKSSFTTAAGTPFLQFQDTVLQDGSRTRLGGELAWMIGPVSIKSEYLNLQLNDLQLGKNTGSFGGNAGYISLGWFLTGEHEPWKNGLPAQITPKRPYVFGKGGGCGALQLLGRYEWLDMDKGLLDKGFVDSSSYTNRASGYTFGLTWYPNDMVRFMLNYYTTKFDNKITVGGKKLDSEEAFLARFEIVW